MIVKNDPEVHYAFRRNLAAQDALAFIGELEALDPNATVGYLSGKLEATRGAWVRIGRYRVESDSFIDPSDLMLYVESYYKPDAGGPVEAVELNHGDVPAGALPAETLDALLDALAQLDYCEAPGNEDPGANASEADETEAAATAGDAPGEAPGTSGGREGELPAMPSRLDGLTILEPAAAPEMRGALTKGWHAMYYEAADGSSLLVFD